MTVAMLAIALLGCVVVASAQSLEPTPEQSPAGMVYSISGVPVFVEHVQERTRTLPDGSESTELIKGKTYRDAAGRLRIELSFLGPSGEPVLMVQLADPVAAFTAILSPQEKFAGRMRMSSKSLGFAIATIGQALPGENWTTTLASLGKRIIEGIEFQGVRRTYTSGDQPPLVAFDEDWKSRELGLNGLATASRPAMASRPASKDVARILKVSRQEPDPDLFKIPSDYSVRDISPE